MHGKKGPTVINKQSYKRLLEITRRENDENDEIPELYRSIYAFSERATQKQILQA